MSNNDPSNSGQNDAWVEPDNQTGVEARSHAYSTGVTITLCRITRKLIHA